MALVAVLALPAASLAQDHHGATSVAVVYQGPIVTAVAAGQAGAGGVSGVPAVQARYTPRAGGDLAAAVSAGQGGVTVADSVYAYRPWGSVSAAVVWQSGR